MGELTAVARLYETGLKRRYRRASVLPGRGEPLCLLSDANDAIRELTRQVEQLMAALTQIVEHRTAMGGLSGRRMHEIAKAALADAVDYADDIIKARDRPALAAPPSSAPSDDRAYTGREER